MPLLYAGVIIIPLVLGSVLLPRTLATDTYGVFFQSFVGGSLLVVVVNIMLLLTKAHDFRKKYQSIGDAMQKMPEGDTWRQVAATAAMTVLRWQRWFIGLVLSSSALLFISGVLFWILLAGALFVNAYFLVSLLPVLVGVDALLAAMYYHSLLTFIIW